MEKSIFVCSTIKEAHWVNKIRKWVEKSKFETPYEIIFVTEHNKISGQENVRTFLLSKMTGCDIGIILVGDEHHDKTWTLALVEAAKQLRLKSFCMRIPLTWVPKPSELGLFREIAFNPNAINKQLKILEACEEREPMLEEH